MNSTDIPLIAKYGRELLRAFRSNEINRKILELRELQTVHHSLKLLSGSAIQTKLNQKPVILCLFKNGVYYIHSFIEHYKRMGFEYFFFIDNGSTDKSIELLKNYDNVTVFQSKLPYKLFKWRFKQYLVRKFGKDRWSLYVDIDELWDYPHSKTVTLSKLIEYLDKFRYTGVMGYMLDMFSIEPISTTSKEIPNSLLEKYPFYDLTGLEKSNYKHKENTFELSELKEYRGGVSNKVFGTKDIYLTKIPFIKWQKGINPHITSHTSSPINLADFTSVLFHFKFTSGLYHKIQRVIKEDNYWDSSSIYKKYAEKLNKEPLLTLHSENARLFSGTNKLLTEGFIQTSTKYLSAHKI